MILFLWMKRWRIQTAAPSATTRQAQGKRPYLYLAVASDRRGAIYLGCIVSPPSLMDDVDAVQAQIARNMLTSGDWVTARLDGIPYLEKAPLIYWMIAVSYKIFGVHDWAARIPVALSAIALGWLTAAFGVWAFGRRAGFLRRPVHLHVHGPVSVHAHSDSRRDADRQRDAGDVGIPAGTGCGRTPRASWALLLAASLGAGLLLKSMVGVLFPLAAGVIYLAITKQLFSCEHLAAAASFHAAAVALAIAAPWHILATLRNPPYFAWTLHSGPGEYHGFLWFFFINEQVLRFLNLRYPRDYNTVPRFCFWLFHLVWLFPWSVYLPAVAKLSYRPVDRAGRTRLLALCWTGFRAGVFHLFHHAGILLDAVLSGAGAAAGLGDGGAGRVAAAGNARDRGAGGCGRACDRHHIHRGDSRSHAGRYFYCTQLASQGVHFVARAYGGFDAQFVRVSAMALLVAGIAFLAGMLGTIRATGQRAYLAAALMMVIFFHAARLALVDFDPFMSSRPLAEALLHAPDGKLLVDHHYYTYSSIFFYTNRDALLVNGRIKNMEYGSYAPGAPDIFIDDSQLKSIWESPGRCYLVASESAMPRLVLLVGAERLNTLASSGGKLVLTNQTLDGARPGTISRLLPQESLALP